MIVGGGDREKQNSALDNKPLERLDFTSVPFDQKGVSSAVGASLCALIRFQMSCTKR